MTKPDVMKGVFAAALTPMTADLAVDHAVMAAHCRWLLTTGCDGLAVLGTTGEANSLSVAERIGVLESLAEAGIDPAALMPGTGCCAITDTVALTRRAVELGAGGVLMLPPFYYKTVSDDGLFAAYAEVIERVGSENLRVYLYHFPQMSAVPLSLALIERLIAAYPGTVAGMKDSSGDLDNMLAVLKAVPGFAVFSGWDRLMAPVLAAGGAGCITAVANIAAPLLRRIYRRGPDAPQAQATIEALRAAVVAQPMVAGLKEVMARHTGDTGWRHLRPPLTAIGAGEGDSLCAAIAATGHRLAPP